MVSVSCVGKYLVAIVFGAEMKEARLSEAKARLETSREQNLG